MKTLKKFEFKTSAATAIYPWGTILGGDILQLEFGKDYQGTSYERATANITVLAKRQGRKIGKSVKVNKVEGGIVMQATPASKEQLKEWEKQDAAKAAEAEASGETEGEEAAE